MDMALLVHYITQVGAPADLRKVLFEEFTAHYTWSLVLNLVPEKLVVLKGTAVYPTQCNNKQNSVSEACNFPVHPRRVDSSVLVFSLSSHRYSYVSLLFSFRFDS